MKTISLLGLSILCQTAALAQGIVTNPPKSSVSLENFKLVAELDHDRAAFTFTAMARVEGAKGGSLELLSGLVALTEITRNKNYSLRAESNRFVLAFDREGRFPVKVSFDAAVRQSGNWKAVDFKIAPGALMPVVLQGLDEETQFYFAGAARPERKGEEFVSFLPSDGAVKLSWKEARAEAE